eukprot:m.217903 g.217903  ORF g.217903 m.217903 type:complete len:298 (-) comp15894_c0_seq1:172-1065(-)
MDLKHLVVLGCLVATAYGITNCDTPDTDNAKCTCNGVEYDFSGVMPNDGNNFFSSPDGDNQWMYYFQMVEGGLPTDGGAMSYCNLDGVSGYAGAQGSLTQDECYALGQVSQQEWTLDDSKDPQEIAVHFTGGQGTEDDARQFYNTFQCDPNNGDPTFTFDREDSGTYYMITTTYAACNPNPSPSPPSPNPPPPSPPSPNPSPPSPGPSPPPRPGPPPPGPQKGNKGLTKGDTITIIVFVLLIMYVAAGMTYQYKVKQESGYGLIPNRDMWVELGSLIKDGCKFSWAKVTKKGEYQSL